MGGVAQLARAREWHSRGRGFDSRRLQYKNITSGFLYITNFIQLLYNYPALFFESGMIRVI